MLKERDRPRSAETRRILVVDGDPDFRQQAGRALAEAGFEVRAAGCATEALQRIRHEGLPHLAIVEIALTDSNGLDFCRRLRQASDVPVIVTTIAKEETVIKALEELAEDYIPKPCQPEVLVAHVRRVLQRIGSFGYAHGREIRVDDRLAVDFAESQAVVNGSRIVLTHTEARLLYILMRSAGCTVTTGFLLGRLSPRDGMHEETLRVHIHNLRLKIEPDPSTPRHVLTEWGAGYRFEPAPGKSEGSPASCRSTSLKGFYS